MGRVPTFKISPSNRARCAKRSKRYRSIHKLTQKSMGELVGCSQNVISKIELGRFDSTVPTRILRAILDLDLPDAPDGDLSPGWERGPKIAQVIEALQHHGTVLKAALDEINVAISLLKSNDDEVPFE